MKEPHHNDAQQRILALLIALFGHEIRGLAPGDLAKMLDEKPHSITRDLANLRIAGIAEEMETGRWRLTPRIPQRAVAMLNSLKQAEDQVEELRQRFTRNPY